VCRWRFEAAGTVHCAAALSPAADLGVSEFALLLELHGAEPVAVVDYRGIRIEHAFDSTGVVSVKQMTR
jgi:hypothetical protein